MLSLYHSYTYITFYYLCCLFDRDQRIHIDSNYTSYFLVIILAHFFIMGFPSGWEIIPKSYILISTINDLLLKQSGMNFVELPSGLVISNLAFSNNVHDTCIANRIHTWQLLILNSAHSTTCFYFIHFSWTQTY